MITTRKTFYEITQEYKISSMGEVQRNYTWGSLELFLFRNFCKEFLGYEWDEENYTFKEIK